MTSICSIVAQLVEAIASFGAGLASCGYGYEPEVPEKLQK